MTVEIGKGSFPSRRDFISLGVGLFVVGSVPLAVRGRRRQLVRRTLPLMGTLGEVAVVHGEERYAQGGVHGGRTWTRDELYEERLSRYGSDPD